MYLQVIWDRGVTISLISCLQLWYHAGAERLSYGSRALFFFFKIFLNHCSQYPMLKYLGNYAVVGKRCLMTHCAQPSRAVCFWGDAFSEQPIVYFISTVVLARMVAILPTSAVNDRTIGSSHTHTHRHIYMLLYFLPCVYSMSFVFFIINPCSNETALSFRVKQNGLWFISS